MDKIEFPKWVYHRTEAPKVVKSEVEFSAIRGDWREYPFVKDEPSKKDIVEKPAEIDEKSVLIGMSEDEIMTTAMKAGITKKQMKGKTRDEIVQMIMEAK